MGATITVLTSGGVDSTTCLAHYLAHGWRVQALWVDYGQRSAYAEERAAERVAEHYGVQLRKVQLRGIQWRTRARGLVEYRARNLTLVALASNMAPEPGLVSLGIHSGTAFADCSEQFAEMLDRLLALVTDGQIRLDCPFLTWAKLQVAEYAKRLQVPLELTYSCERGTTDPCGECDKCLERKQFFGQS